MARSRGWRTQGAAIVAAMILVASPARAGCSLSDIFNAAKSTVGGLESCASACATGVGCAAAGFLTSSLGGVADEGGQGAVNSFCSQAEGVNDVDQVVGILKSVGGAGDQVASVLSSAGSLTSVVKCACDTEQGAGSLGSDIGDCIQDGLCWLQNEIFNDPCSCTPPPPQIGNCAAIDVKACEGKDLITRMHMPECRPSGTLTNDNPLCQSGPYKAYQMTLACTTTSEGTFVTQVPPTAEDAVDCSPLQYCFCPAPMKADWQKVLWEGSEYYVFACECPDGTHPGATMPNGISSCFCDNTNQPPILPPIVSTQGICPPPACPSGQVRLGGVGDCVTPCADPKQGMAFDGSCCNPAQMTTCGQCCPPDTMPDPKSGTCVPAPQPPK